MKYIYLIAISVLDSVLGCLGDRGKGKVLSIDSVASRWNSPTSAGLRANANHNLGGHQLSRAGSEETDLRWNSPRVAQGMRITELGRHQLSRVGSEETDQIRYGSPLKTSASTQRSEHPATSKQSPGSPLGKPPSSADRSEVGGGSKFSVEITVGPHRVGAVKNVNRKTRQFRCKVRLAGFRGGYAGNASGLEITVRCGFRNSAGFFNRNTDRIALGQIRYSAKGSPQAGVLEICGS